MIVPYSSFGDRGHPQSHHGGDGEIWGYHCSERATLRQTLEPDDFSSNRHPALSLYLSMIFSENRYPLFRIML